MKEIVSLLFVDVITKHCSRMLVEISEVEQLFEEDPFLATDVPVELLGRLAELLVQSRGEWGRACFMRL